MKILVQQPTEPIIEGILQTLISIGENVIVWNPTTPAQDLLDIHKPELTICYNDSLKVKPTGKLILVGEHSNNIRPDLLCRSANQHHIDKDAQSRLSYANEVLFLETAANFAYTNMGTDTKDKTDPKYKTDLFYYSQNTTPEILKYLLDIEPKYQLKIIGPHRLPLPSYLGVGDSDDIVKFMRSCKIALAFDSSVLYTYAANNVFCVTNQNTDLFPPISDLEKIAKYDVEQIDKIVDKAYNYVIAHHTYFHRVHNIFTRLGYLEQAEKCLTTLKQITNPT